MADLKKRLKENIAGEFFVDSTCINCDTCRQLAPSVFEDTGEYSKVYNQPTGEIETNDALRALLACPTGSIGTLNENKAKSTLQDFPIHIEEDVYYCGFNSPKSYGGNSYFIKNAKGNWLIDSPKFNNHLANQLQSLGGVDYIFLTHRDDVADANKYAKHFGSPRIIHNLEKDAEPGAEVIIEDLTPTEFLDNYLIIPTPGHTEGHCCLLYKNKFLFTGDTLSWSRYNKQLRSSKDYCWFNYSEQIRSIESLRNFNFEWILPGHGQKIKLPKEVMKAELNSLIIRMKEL